MKRLIVALLFCLLPSLAHAQSACQWMITGYVPTAAQWQSCWQAKQDLNGAKVIDLVNGAVLVEYANASTVGTTVGFLAKQVLTSPTTAVTTATTDTGGVIGIVLSETNGALNGVTSGNAQIVGMGQAPCQFDSGVTTGDYVQISSTVAGNCHDVGNAFPNIGQVIGRVISASNAGAGTYNVEVFPNEIRGGTGSGGPPGGPNGAVQANSGGAFAGFVVNGDCTLNTSTGAIVCTKTIGVAFAPSATTDTTNAGNIISGTLAAARLPAFVNAMTAAHAMHSYGGL